MAAPLRRRDAGCMARQPRLDLPGIPQHIVQRGNNHLPCFLDDNDHACYRQLLREALHATRYQLHAYVLMENHVHLLATPPDVGATSRLMQLLGRNYVGRKRCPEKVSGKGVRDSCALDFGHIVRQEAPCSHCRLRRHQVPRWTLTDPEASRVPA